MSRRRSYAECEACRSPAIRLERHHVVPQRAGGDDGDDNLVDLCLSCHDLVDRSLLRDTQAWFLRERSPHPLADVIITDLLLYPRSEVREEASAFVTLLRRDDNRPCRASTLLALKLIALSADGCHAAR